VATLGGNWCSMSEVASHGSVLRLCTACPRNPRRATTQSILHSAPSKDVSLDTPRNATFSVLAFSAQHSVSRHVGHHDFIAVGIIRYHIEHTTVRPLPTSADHGSWVRTLRKSAAADAYGHRDMFKLSCALSLLATVGPMCSLLRDTITAQLIVQAMQRAITAQPYCRDVPCHLLTANQLGGHPFANRVSSTAARLAVTLFAH
jgi:hypothetical protein